MKVENFAAFSETVGCGGCVGALCRCRASVQAMVGVFVLHIGVLVPECERPGDQRECGAEASPNNPHDR